MKVGNQALPVSAQVGSTRGGRSLPPQGSASEIRRPDDRVEISREASQLSASARAGLATGKTREEVQELVARANREASRTASPANLEALLAVAR